MAITRTDARNNLIALIKKHTDASPNGYGESHWDGELSRFDSIVNNPDCEVYAKETGEIIYRVSVKDSANKLIQYVYKHIPGDYGGDNIAFMTYQNAIAAGSVEKVM